MTERDQENVEIPERAHDQPVEGGREQAEQAVERVETGRPEKGDSPAEAVE